MKNQKSTKKALLSSVLSLVICLTMLIGTTFAWFTDSVTSSGNKIKSGSLKVELLMNTGSGYQDISDSDKPIFGTGSIAQNNNAETLWEPGKTQVAYLAIKNAGNLDLKYTVALDVENVSKDLYEVMEYTITPDAQYDSVKSWVGNGKTVTTGIQTVAETTALEAGSTHYFALSIHMKEEAGNEYQDGEVNFDIDVLATQLASEYDSFDNQYDASAWYELQQDETGAYLIFNANDLMSFNAKMNEPGLNGEGNSKLTYKLMSDIDMAGYEWLSVNEMFLTFDGNGHTISNLSCVENGNKSGFFGYLGGATIKNLILENVISTGSQAGIFVGQAEGGNVVNCNIAGINFVAWDDDSADAITKNGVGAYVGVSVETNTTSGTIENGAKIYLSSDGMADAASGVWAENNDYVGGLYTTTQNINVINNGTLVASLDYVSEGLYIDSSVTKPTYYVTSGEGLGAFAQWRNSTTVGEGNPYNAVCNLLCDVDMTGVSYSAFNGHFTQFNGNGYTISNLNAGQGVSGKGGLVSYLGGGLIQDVTLENATVTGCQVGLFAGQTEGGKILNCFVKGDNKVIWSQNTTSSYVETWNGIGAIVGYSSGGTFNAEILEGATVVLDATGMTSEGTKVDDLTGYGNANAGTVVNNGTVSTMIKVSDTTSLNAAVVNGIDTVYLEAGTYELKGSQADGVSIVGVGDGVEVSNLTNFAGNGNYGAIWQNMNFENVIFTEKVYTMADGAQSTFKNCTFEQGFRQGYSRGVVFEGCTFYDNSEGFAMHFEKVYTTLTVKDCKFVEGTIAFGDNGEGLVTFDKCTFSGVTTRTEYFDAWASCELNSCTFAEGTEIWHEQWETGETVTLNNTTGAVVIQK